MTWRTVIEGSEEKTSIRAEAGGLVELPSERGDLVHEDDVICTLFNPFPESSEDVPVPVTGVRVGVLENPLVHPGNPLCHLVRFEDHLAERPRPRKPRSRSERQWYPLTIPTPAGRCHAADSGR